MLFPHQMRRPTPILDRIKRSIAPMQYSNMTKPFTPVSETHQQPRFQVKSMSQTPTLNESHNFLRLKSLQKSYVLKTLVEQRQPHPKSQAQFDPEEITTEIPIRALNEDAYQEQISPASQKKAVECFQDIVRAPPIISFNPRVLPPIDDPETLHGYKVQALAEISEFLEEFEARIKTQTEFQNPDLADYHLRVMMEQQRRQLIDLAGSCDEIVNINRELDAMASELHCCDLLQKLVVQIDYSERDRIEQFRELNTEFDRQLIDVKRMLLKRKHFKFTEETVVLSPQELKAKAEREHRIQALKDDIKNGQFRLERIQQKNRLADELGRLVWADLHKYNLDSLVQSQIIQKSPALDQFDVVRKLMASIAEIDTLGEKDYVFRLTKTLRVLIVEQTRDKEVLRSFKAKVVSEANERLQQMEEVKQNIIIKRLLVVENRFIEAIKGANSMDDVLRLEEKLNSEKTRISEMADDDEDDTNNFITQPNLSQEEQK